MSLIPSYALVRICVPKDHYSLAQMLDGLSTDKLLELQTALIDAGITREFKGDHRAVFKRLRERSTGKAKKIYSALAKSSKEEMARMSDALLSINNSLSVNK